MGCVNSRTDINDLHQNIFQVMNVDDQGNLITPGRLEITDFDIVLYQRGKPPVKWPLRCLRRYGYDSEIFSFESGRRCSTGPGIYAFKCRRADQLFNLVQSNIQVCNSTGDDTVSRDLSVTAHTAPMITRMTIPPLEANYLDPMVTRNNARLTSRFSHSQQNGVGRLGSVGSSSGPMSPQGTMGSPSPPPILPIQGSLITPSSISQLMSQPPVHHHSSAVYVNDQVLSAIAMEIELDNNNKSLRRTMHRSHTVSSTSSSGFLSDPPSSKILGHQDMKYHSRPAPLDTGAAAYINIDIGTEQNSPMSPTHSIFNAVQLSSDETNLELDRTCHAYMNLNPGQETGLEVILRGGRQSVLPEPHQHHAPPTTNKWDELLRHCYTNVDHTEIEELKIRLTPGDAVTGIIEKSSPLQPPPPAPLPPPLLASQPTVAPFSSSPPPSELIREVNYAILDLDKNHLSSTSSSATLENTSYAVPSPPDSPNKPQKGYATIDFNKTAALSHSVNPNVVNDNEGSRKTRHNSTINDLTTPSTHSSSISE